MLCIWVFAVLALAPQQSSQGEGLQFVERVEVRSSSSTPGGEAPPAPSVRALPAGEARIEYVTDGKSVRTTLHGRVNGAPDGTVTLALAGDSMRYVLNTNDKTFRVRETAVVTASESGASRVSATESYDVIDGIRARKYILVASPSSNAPSPANADRKAASAPRIEIEVWCTSEYRVPRSLTSMTNGALRFLGRSDGEAFAKACPLPVRSVMRISTAPGVETTSTLSMIRRVVPPPSLFVVPSDYRRLQ